jgi:hypothetical protein
VPPTYNSWVLAEDMLLFHTRALQQQLEQAYIGMGLAAAAGRGFALPQASPCTACTACTLHITVLPTAASLLTPCASCCLLPKLNDLSPCCPCLPAHHPQFSCFCQNGESALPRCRRLDAKDLKFPVACPEGEVLAPLEQFTAEPAQRGTPLDVQPASFAQAALKDKVGWGRQGGVAGRAVELCGACGCHFKACDEDACMVAGCGRFSWPACLSACWHSFQPI